MHAKTNTMHTIEDPDKLKQTTLFRQILLSVYTRLK